jgi:hypothetical protein
MEQLRALDRAGCGAEERFGVLKDCTARNNGLLHVGREVNGSAYDAEGQE